jgi:FtsP/CotA-like multicopper oxidase with cupredoxin domain
MSLWKPQGEAYTIFAQSMDRTGYARGTLATREGLSAAVPALDPRPLLTMEDMGMGGMGHDMAGMDHSQMGGMNNSGEMMSMDGAELADSGTSSAPMDHSSRDWYGSFPDGRNAGYAKSSCVRNG